MTVTMLVGDALATLRTLPPQSVRCCVTSPPYFGLRDYGVRGQLGLEELNPDICADGRAPDSRRRAAVRAAP
jgi:DNA modification methylase